MFDELTRNELYSIVAKIEDYTRGVKISIVFKLELIGKTYTRTNTGGSSCIL